MTARARLLSATLLAVGVAVGGGVLARSHGLASSVSSTVSHGSNDGVARALAQRLTGKGLSYRWVVCVCMQRHYAGRRLYRCNVNFGDPHILPYCAALIGGKLLTDHENTRLNCGARVQADERDESVYFR